MIKSPNPDYRKLVQQKFKVNNFSHFIGFQLTSIKDGYIEGELHITDEHRQQNAFVHGGIVLSLCDIVAGFAAFTMVQNEQHVVTAEIKVSCLRPGTGKKLIAKGIVLKPGRNIHFCESEVWSEDEEGNLKLIAKSSSSMAVMN